MTVAAVVGMVVIVVVLQQNTRRKERGGTKEQDAKCLFISQSLVSSFGESI